MLRNVLETCGLNSSERAVMVCLLERGAGIASVIAKNTGLKRPTVYAALDNLLDWGLVLKQKKGAVTYFSLVKLELIPTLLEARAQRSFESVQNATRLLGKQMAQFEGVQGVELAGFNVMAIESVAVIYAELESSLLGGDFCGIFNPQLAFDTKEVRDLVVHFLGKTAQLQPYIREIAVEGEMTDWYKSHIKNLNHIVKEIPADQKILSDMIFVNGGVFIAHYEPSREVAIKVTHPDYYQSMLTVFEMLWKGF